MFRIFFSPRIAPQLATTGCELHLVKPLGIDLSEPKPRRAGLDYHDLTFVIVHPKLDATWAVPTPPSQSSHRPTTPADPSPTPSTAPRDVVLFGPGPTGLEELSRVIKAPDFVDNSEVTLRLPDTRLLAGTVYLPTLLSFIARCWQRVD